jgi:hypothetical protein
MRKNISNKLLMACCLLVMASCAARKHVVVARKADSTAKPADNNVNSRLDAIRGKQAKLKPSLILMVTAMMLP